MGVATARAGNVIGGGDWATDRLVPDFVRAIQRGEPIRLRQPRAVRPWQFVLEPLGGYLLLAERLWREPGAFASAWNFGPAPASHTTVLQLAQHLVAAFGRGAIEIVEDDALHETGYLALDCTKARDQLGWRPLLDVEQSIAWTAEWYSALSGEPAAVATVAQQQVRRYERLFLATDDRLRKVA